MVSRRPSLSNPRRNSKTSSNRKVDDRAGAVQAMEGVGASFLSFVKRELCGTALPSLRYN